MTTREIIQKLQNTAHHIHTEIRDESDRDKALGLILEVAEIVTKNNNGGKPEAKGATSK